MVDKKIDETETQEIKKIYNHCLDKTTDIGMNTHFKVEDVFGDFLGTDRILPEQKSKLDSVLVEMM